MAGPGGNVQTHKTQALPFAGRRAAGGTSLVDKVDRVGALIAILIAAALAFEPFVTFRANRIVSGKGLSLLDTFSVGEARVAVAVLAAAALFALLRSRAALRLVVGIALLAGLALLVGYAPAHLVTDEHPLARVSPAGGFWILTFAFSMLVTDALAKLSPGPAPRLAVLALAWLALGALFGSGRWDGLSVMQEYAVHADNFWQEAARHIELVVGSVAAAVAFGVPLGIACVKLPALRAVALPVLNIVQTIPSIAMYGLMMVPLGLLAAHVPLAAALGIRGIGVAPALIALFLYSLLPVTASVVVGLGQIPPQTAEAAVAMGMTPGQRLRSVELPLALPVVLTGVRIVLVQNIGLATVAALIGGGGFGTFVFQGIGQAAIDLVLLGAAPTIGLALSAAVIFDAATEFIKGSRA